MFDLDSCEHIIEDDVCVNCGLIFENNIESKLEFTKNYPRIAGGKNSILDNLKNVPQEVLIRARQNIYRKQSNSGKKIRNDNKNTFIQVYEAYLQLGYNNYDPQKLAESLSLSRKDINCCLKISSGTSLLIDAQGDDTKFPSIAIRSPVAYIDIICKRNNIVEYGDEIKILTSSILKKKDILYSSKPEYVACAIVKLFCEKKKIQTKNFSKNNSISDNALKKSTRDISEFF